MNETLKHALGLTTFGFSIIPIDSKTKKPLVEWLKYQTTPASKEEIKEWFEKYPDAGLANITGKISGICVVDVDPRNGGENALFVGYDTVSVKTGGGGFHYYFAYPKEGIASHPHFIKGIDFKSDGGYVICPPSKHPSGGSYEWINPPSKAKIIDLPTGIREVIERNTTGSSPSFDLSNLGGVPEGQRNEVAAKVAGKLLRNAKPEDLPVIWQFFVTWNEKNIPPMRESELKSVFDSIAKKESRNPKELYIEQKPNNWPKPMADDAFVGLAGEIVKTIEPHSEADRVALLMNFLTGFGSVIGDQAHFKVEADKHPMRLFCVLVGESARGRKGTSWGFVRNLLISVDPEWEKRLVGGGLSSGEGLIWAVRDKITKRQPVKEHGRVVDYQEIIEDEGLVDKRLLVVESELSSTLRVLQREGNTLSALIRNAWDSGNLQMLTKNSPAQATGAHISIIGHITKEELLRYLTSTETSNGFGNRFIWLCVKRSKTLPRGSNISGVNFGPILNHLSSVVDFAKRVEEIKWDKGTEPLWDGIYEDLTEEEPGLLGSITARSEAYVTRLACIYALLDKSSTIKIKHLKAAVAVWDYARASAEYIFQGRSGDPLANKIIEALSGKPEGMTRTDIYIYFGKNISSEQISISLENLEKIGRIKKDDISPAGRSKALFTLNTLNTYPHSEKNYLKKLNQYIDQLGIKEGSLGTNNSGEDYANNVSNVFSSNDDPEITIDETSLNSLPGLEGYGH